MTMPKTCTRCNGQVATRPRLDLPTHRWDYQGASGPTFLISHPSEPDPSGLCYFHLKVAQGLFEETWSQEVLRRNAERRTAQ